ISLFVLPLAINSRTCISRMVSTASVCAVAQAQGVAQFVRHYCLEIVLAGAHAPAPGDLRACPVAVPGNGATRPPDGPAAASSELGRIARRRLGLSSAFQPQYSIGWDEIEAPIRLEGMRCRRGYPVFPMPAGAELAWPHGPNLRR